MKHNEDVTWREWVDLDLEGQLSAVEKAGLASLEQSPEVMAERRCLERLHSLLDAEKIAVFPGFKEQVMAALPVAPWEQRSAARSLWALPAALVLIFGAAAAMFLAGTLGDSQALGIAATVFDFLQTTTLAGAGLLFATWRGLGFGLSELFAGSQLSLALFGATVLGLDLLIVSYLRRRRPAAAVEKRREGE